MGLKLILFFVTFKRWTRTGNPIWSFKVNPRETNPQEFEVRFLQLQDGVLRTKTYGYHCVMPGPPSPTTTRSNQNHVDPNLAIEHVPFRPRCIFFPSHTSHSSHSSSSPTSRADRFNPDLEEQEAMLRIACERTHLNYESFAWYNFRNEWNKFLIMIPPMWLSWG